MSTRRFRKHLSCFVFEPSIHSWSRIDQVLNDVKHGLPLAGQTLLTTRAGLSYASPVELNSKYKSQADRFRFLPVRSHWVAKSLSRWTRDVASAKPESGSSA
jgi:hypothetical protein